MTFFNNASTSEMNNTYSEPDDSVEVTDAWENHFDKNNSADIKKFLHSMNSSENYDRNTPFPNELTLDLEFIFKIIIFVLSVTANTVAIVVVIKHRTMRTPTNLLLCNLLVANLMMICTPMQITDNINYLQAVLVTTSAYSITTMAGNLCVAIKQFGKIPTLSNSNSTLILITFLWILVLIVFAPLIIMTSEEYSTENVTMSTKRLKIKILHILFLIITFAIPGFLIVLTYFLTRQQLCSPNPVFNVNEGSPSSQRNIRYIRERKRVAWILLLLGVLFIICWLPYHVMQLFVDSEYAPQNAVAGMMTYALLLGHTNSAINPIVYCFMTKSFSKHIKKLLCRTSSKKSSTQEQQQYGMRMRRLNRNNADIDLGKCYVTGDSQCPHCENLMSRYAPPNPGQEVPSPQHSDFEYYII